MFSLFKLQHFQIGCGCFKINTKCKTLDMDLIFFFRFKTKPILRDIEVDSNSPLIYHWFDQNFKIYSNLGECTFKLKKYKFKKLRTTLTKKDKLKSEEKASTRQKTFGFGEISGLISLFSPLCVIDNFVYLQIISLQCLTW